MVGAKYEEDRAKLLSIGPPACKCKLYLQMAKLLFQFPPMINYFYHPFKTLMGKE